MKDDYVSTAKIKPKAKPATPLLANVAEVESPAVAERKARVNQALLKFEALTESERNSVLGEFQLAASTHKRLKPGSMMFRKTIGNWLVDAEDKLATPSRSRVSSSSHSRGSRQTR